MSGLGPSLGRDYRGSSDSPLARHPSPAPSGFDSNLADANQGIFVISDSRSPSPIPIDTEDMFVISESPPRYPSPALSELHLDLAEANQDIFALTDSRVPHHPSSAPSNHHSYLTEANQDIFAIQDSPPPSPKYIDTEDMFMISESPSRSEAKVTFPIPF